MLPTLEIRLAQKNCHFCAVNTIEQAFLVGKSRKHPAQNDEKIGDFQT